MQKNFEKAGSLPAVRKPRSEELSQARINAIQANLERTYPELFVSDRARIKLPNPSEPIRWVVSRKVAVIAAISLKRYRGSEPEKELSVKEAVEAYNLTPAELEGWINGERSVNGQKRDLGINPEIRSHALMNIALYKMSPGT